MDPRRSRSRAKLQAALKTLLADAGIEQIRVEELCRVAGVTRPTFYANCGSVHGLLDDYLADLIDRLRVKISQHMSDAGPALPNAEKQRRAEAVLTWFFDAVGTDDPRMRCLLNEGEAVRIEAPFAALFRELLNVRQEEDPGQPWLDPVTREIPLHFFTGAILALLRLRFSQPEPMPASVLATHAALLMTYGRAGLLSSSPES